MFNAGSHVLWRSTRRLFNSYPQRVAFSHTFHQENGSWIGREIDDAAKAEIQECSLAKVVGMVSLISELFLCFLLF